MRRLIILRRCSQIFFLLLFVYIFWSTTYPLKGVISPRILFKFDPLIMFFTALSQRVILPGLIFSVVMAGLTLVLGRFFCGWMCPLGTLVDWAGRIGRKKIVLREKQNKIIRSIKFFGLGIVAFFAFLGIQLAWALDPIALMGRVVSLNIIPAVTWGINGIFILGISRLGLGGNFYDFYRSLKGTILGVDVHFFGNSLITFLIFLGICGAALFLARAWCRALCPLGALYALLGRLALLRRVVDGCVDCGKCRRACRMGAIKPDASYHPGECILCMDCIYTCPPRATRFRFLPGVNEKKSGAASGAGLSRKNFLMVLFSSLPFLSGMKPAGAGTPCIRPPGSLTEKQFVNVCVRCGNCMKVCITNGLQPVVFKAGLEGIWTPELIPEVGYCEYNCTLCGHVCPTGAIRPLTSEAKRITKLGSAEIDHAKCLAWGYGEQCLVCEEHCPVSEKAIKIEEKMIAGKKVLVPRVDETACIGCGICQNKCPASPVRAIRVNPERAARASIH